jgi:hypothetical protein
MFSQKSSIPTLTEVCPVGSAMIHVDRWTGAMRATGPFCKHVDMTKNGRVIVEYSCDIY